MVTATSQILLIDIFIFNDNIINTSMSTLCLLVTGSTAIAVTIMNQHMPTTQPWFVTPGSAIDLLVLVTALRQLANSVRYILGGTNASEHMTSLWMSVLTASSYRGAPLTSDIFLMIVISLIATISPRLGSQDRHIVMFSRIVGIAPIIMAPINMRILLVHGISTIPIGSAPGTSSMGQSFPYIVFRVWTASTLLGAIVVKIIVLPHQRMSAMKHTAYQFVPVATSAQQPQYVNYRPHAPWAPPRTPEHLESGERRRDRRHSPERCVEALRPPRHSPDSPHPDGESSPSRAYIQPEEPAGMGPIHMVGGIHTS